MRVVLQKDVPRLGRQGDEVEVADGYARNYLLPQGLAVVPTPANRDRIAAIRRQAEKVEAERRAQFETLQQELQGRELVFEVRVAKEGHLYGSVHAHLIAQELQRQGFPIEPEAVRLEEPIKAIGDYPVRIHLYGDLEAEVRVLVRPLETETSSSETESNE